MEQAIQRTLQLHREEQKLGFRSFQGGWQHVENKTGASVFGGRGHRVNVKHSESRWKRAFIAVCKPHHGSLTRLATIIAIWRLENRPLEESGLPWLLHWIFDWLSPRPNRYR
jgi:hypothetical protein